MIAMQPMMMRHAMEHMRMSLMRSMAESMSECPMMKSMCGASKEGARKEEDPHKGHHD